MSPSDPGLPEGAHRLAVLLGAPVVDGDARPLGRVTDLRLAPGPRGSAGPAELVVTGLIVDRRYRGSMLGYDRRGDQGPWIVRVVMRRVHRHARFLPWAGVGRIIWPDEPLLGRAQVVADPRALEPLHALPR
jgi:hypothetical protein